MTEFNEISYNDFVIGLAKRTLSFEIKERKAFAILFFDNFIVWLTRVLLLLIVIPILIIPFISFKLDNWWLLFGFIGLYLGNIIHGINSKTSNPIKNFVELTLAFSFLLFILIYFIGILNPFVFSFASLVYAFFFMDLSNNVYDELAKNKLIEDERNFYYALDNHIIEIMKK